MNIFWWLTSYLWAKNFPDLIKRFDKASTAFNLLSKWGKGHTDELGKLMFESYYKQAYFNVIWARPKNYNAVKGEIKKMFDVFKKFDMERLLKEDNWLNTIIKENLWDAKLTIISNDMVSAQSYIVWKQYLAIGSEEAYVWLPHIMKQFFTSKWNIKFSKANKTITIIKNGKKIKVSKVFHNWAWGITSRIENPASIIAWLEGIKSIDEYWDIAASILMLNLGPEVENWVIKNYPWLVEKVKLVMDEKEYVGWGLTKVLKTRQFAEEVSTDEFKERLKTLKETDPYFWNIFYNKDIKHYEFHAQHSSGLKDSVYISKNDAIFMADPTAVYTKKIDTMLNSFFESYNKKDITSQSIKLPYTYDEREVNAIFKKHWFLELPSMSPAIWTYINKIITDNKIAAFVWGDTKKLFEKEGKDIYDIVDVTHKDVDLSLYVSDMNINEVKNNVDALRARHETNLNTASIIDSIAKDGWAKIDTIESAVDKITWAMLSKDKIYIALPKKWTSEKAYEIVESGAEITKNLCQLK